MKISYRNNWSCAVRLCLFLLDVVNSFYMPPISLGINWHNTHQESKEFVFGIEPGFFSGHLCWCFTWWQFSTLNFSRDKFLFVFLLDTKWKFSPSHCHLLFVSCKMMCSYIQKIDTVTSRCARIKITITSDQYTELY